jgi:Family of unknown function (DUF6064)
MDLPFTTEQFLKVFQNYNLSVWPMQVILLLLGIAALYLGVKSSSNSGRTISVILAFLWLWMGVVYHLVYFTAINKAAYAFGFLYIVQSLVFLYVGVFRASLSFQYRSDRYGITGTVLILFAMVIYPVLGYMLGHIYPQSPTFGLPCPTTIFTFGILLWTDKKVTLLVLAIPFLWSIIGFTAALSLGIREDIGLLIAGLVGTFLIVMRNRSGAYTLIG